MELVDVFCGIGGFSAGAMEFATPVFGVDDDDLMVRLWAANTKGVAKLATLWCNYVDWPTGTGIPLHIHVSPPCTELSKARREKSNVLQGLETLYESLQFLCNNQYRSWSIETVSMPKVRDCLLRFKEENSEFEMDWATVDASDYGCPSSRIRIIVGSPSLISELRQIPVRRTSVADAFRATGVDTLPSEYIKNNTRTRSGKPCVRHVSRQCHTQTASHPLVWCTKEGDTIRCLNVAETAVIMGFPGDWMFPTMTRSAIKAIGNAVPPPLASAITLAALKSFHTPRCV